MSDLERAGSEPPPAGGAATTGPRDLQPSTERPAAGPISESATLPKYCPQCGIEYDAALSFCPKDGNVLQVRHGEHSLVGQILGRHYRILELLGEGGMGQVFLAEHVRIGRRCAIKVMRPALVRDPGAVGRFGREAMTAGRINHRNAVAVYDFGETDDGLIYIVMEHVEGESLSHRLVREGALAPVVASTIALQITDALIAAHRLGIIHRDLKPDNILVGHDEDGRELVKVVDFGIAKAIDGSNQTTLTRTGFVLGTLQYMSPEQLIGEHLDGRSDIYSLGCILYEMLTGERTFAGPSGPAVVVRRLTEPAPTVRSRKPELPEELDALVTRALARTAADRFQSAEELKAALLAFLGPAAGVGGATATMPLPLAVAPGPGTTAAPLATPPVSGPAPVLTPPVSGPAPAVAPPAVMTPGVMPPKAEAREAIPPAAMPPAAETPPAPFGAAPSAPTSAVAPAAAPATGPGATPRTGEETALAAAALRQAPMPSAPPAAVTDPVGRPLEALGAPAAAARPRRRAALLAVGGLGVLVAAFVVIRLVRQPSAADAAGPTTTAQATPVTEAPTPPATAGVPGAGAAATAKSPPVTPAAPTRDGGAAAAVTAPASAPASRPAPVTRAAEAPAAAAHATMRVLGALPAGAAVLLDGRPTTGTTFTASPGPHTVSVVATGYQPATWTGRLGAGESRSWRVSLRPVPPPAAPVTSTTPVASAPASSPAAPPPVAAPAPAPVTPAPATAQPSAASDDATRAQIAAAGRRAADDLATAIGSREMTAVRRAWPDIPGEAARRWREFLLSPDNSGIAARVAAVRPPILENGSASVPFAVAVDFTNRVSGHGSATSRFTASFARQGSDWVLTGIRAGW